MELLTEWYGCQNSGLWNWRLEPMALLRAQRQLRAVFLTHPGASWLQAIKARNCHVRRRHFWYCVLSFRSRIRLDFVFLMPLNFSLGSQSLRSIQIPSRLS
jgi:hypothetical protein